MSMEIIPFEYAEVQINVVKDGKGEPWFVAKDVCAVLGYAKPQNAVAQHCKYAKRLSSNDSLRLTGQANGITIIPEPDLYRLIMRSNMPYAEQFQTWVVEEVLPRIRKTGGYLMNEENMTEDELVLKAMQVMKNKVDLYRKQLEEQKPKVEAFEQLMDAKGSYSFRDSARILGMQEKQVINTPQKERGQANLKLGLGRASSDSHGPTRTHLVY